MSSAPETHTPENFFAKLFHQWASGAAGAVQPPAATTQGVDFGTSGSPQPGLSFGAGAGGKMGQPQPAAAAPVAPAAAEPAANPFASILQSIMSAGKGVVAPSGGSPALQLLKQIQQNRDPVGQYNNRSNLPSDAPGSTSPFATGFFKQQKPK